MGLRACTIVLVAVLLLLLPARIEIQDEEVFLNTAVNVLTTGLPVYTAEGLTFYQRYSPVYATLLACHLAVVKAPGDLLSRLAPAYGGLLNWGLVLTFNILIVALLFLVMARTLAGPPALWLTAFLSSYLLFYATTLFMDLLIALLLFLAVALAARQRWMPAALSLALLAMLKVTNLVYAPILALLILLRAIPVGAPTPISHPDDSLNSDPLSSTRRSSRSRVRTMIAAGLVAVGIPIAFHLAFNVIVRGRLTDFGYAPSYPDPLTGAWLPQGFTHPILRGLAGFLLSPGKSLFLYAPLALPGVWGLARGWRLGNPLARIAVVFAATTIALYSAWSQWEGGMCYGPRLILPAVPLLLSGLAWIDLTRHRRAVIALAVIGLVVNVSARILPIFPAYLASGAYGTGSSYPLAHNFLADQFSAVSALASAPAGTPPVNLVPALLAVDPGAATRLLIGLWLVIVATLTATPFYALSLGPRPQADPTPDNPTK